MVYFLVEATIADFVVNVSNVAVMDLVTAFPAIDFAVATSVLDNAPVFKAVVNVVLATDKATCNAVIVVLPKASSFSSTYAL